MSHQPIQHYNLLNKYRFGFNGMEKDDEVKGQGNSLDFGARIYDSRTGRWLSTDPLQAKYPFISSYSMAINSPLVYKDIDGRDVFLIIWATKPGSFGHAALAVSNYKVDLNSSGDIFIPDGTFTYYDLWPSGGSFTNSPKSAFKDFNASYQNKELIGAHSVNFNGQTINLGSPITENTIINTDVNEREDGKIPNGVIRIKTNATIDANLKIALEKYIKDNPIYEGASNNCSDFALYGINYVSEKNINNKDGQLDENFGKEKFIIKFTTPNELYKDTRDLIMKSNGGVKSGNAGSVQGLDSDFIGPFITDDKTFGLGSSTSADGK